MDVKSFNNKIQLLIRELDNNRDKETLLLAKEARALIVRRIQNEGKDANNKNLGSYSNNPLPSFFYDDILSTAQERKLRKEKSKKGRDLSYKEVRKLAGRQTGYVDLTFSGDMWKGTVALLEESTPNTSTATIKGKTLDVAKKLGYNSDRYGNILRVTKNEQTQLEQARLDRLIGTIKRVL